MSSRRRVVRSGDFLHKQIACFAPATLTGSVPALKEIRKEALKNYAKPEATIRRYVPIALHADDDTYAMTRSAIARKLFDNDPRTKLAMSKLEVPQFARAYARGIFGYSPETEWAAAAWELATAVTT